MSGYEYTDDLGSEEHNLDQEIHVTVGDEDQIEGCDEDESDGVASEAPDELEAYISDDDEMIENLDEDVSW